MVQRGCMRPVNAFGTSATGRPGPEDASWWLYPAVRHLRRCTGHWLLRNGRSDSIGIEWYFSSEMNDACRPTIRRAIMQ